MVFNVTTVTFWMALQILSPYMTDEFVRWLKRYLLLSATRDEILSWMIEIWMKNHFVSDNNCDILNLLSPKKFTRNDKHVGLTFSVGDTTLQFTISIEQDI